MGCKDKAQRRGSENASFIPGRKGESTLFKNNSFWQGIIYNGEETPKRSSSFKLKILKTQKKAKDFFKNY